MTPNDTQMDVLMRRYAKGAKRLSVSTEHLDADELNAFAEGALPAATRSRYVSHLADCDDCRTVVSQLAMSAGAGTAAQVPASESSQKRPWWQSFGALLSAPALRYAASAVILLAVVGIAFVVWRQSVQQRNSSLVARNEPSADQAPVVGSPTVPLTSNNQGLSQSTERNPQTNVQPTPGATKAGESPAVDAPAPRAASDAPAESTIIASDRAMKAPPRAESTPSYAPPPLAENSRVDSRQREQSPQQVQQQQTNVAGIVQHGGPRRSESNEKYKGLDDRGRAVDLAKSRDDDRAKSANQTASTEKKEQDAVQARAGSVSGASLPRSPSKVSEEATKDDKTGRSQSDEMTSVGGRKFRRLGNAWVDLKFKSSMPVTTVSRGSGDFAALDSKVRSIAQQLGGEVIVVWKGKAYRIR